MAPSAQRKGATCPICLDYLDSSSRVISLAPCGHILHRACYDRCAAAAAAGLGGPPGRPRCPMCRSSVAEDRIKSASAVPGARLDGSFGYAQYAPRSALPPPPARDLHPAALASMAPVEPPASGGLREATGAPAAANIPAGARDQLLAGIMAQLGAARPAVPPPPPAAQTGNSAGSRAGLNLLRMLRQAHAARRAGQTTAAARAVQLAPAAAPAVAAAVGPLPAGPGAVSAAAGPSTWCFALDVSSSMGSSQDWQAGSVSRLCFALASLACVVDAKVAPGDWVTVQAFDDDQATLKQWFRKPAAIDKAGFLAELTGAVRACGLERFGTCTCAAVEMAVETLASKANSLAAPQQGFSGGGAAPQGSAEGPASATTQLGAGPAQLGADPPQLSAGPRQLGAAHSLVLLTDGWADDQYSGFDAASELLCDPPFVTGGFKALLIHIAAQGESASCLARLAADPTGAPLGYVQVLRLQIGASLDLSAATHAAEALAMPAGHAPPARPPAPPAAAAPNAAGHAGQAAAAAAAAPNAAADAGQAAAAAAVPAISAPPAFPVPRNPPPFEFGPNTAAALQLMQWIIPARQTAPRWDTTIGGHGRWGAIPEEEEEDISSGGSSHDDWRSVSEMSSGIATFASSRLTSRPSASASSRGLQPSQWKPGC